MLDAAREAVMFTKDQDRKTLDGDRKLVLSLVKSIEIIGEAASKVSDERRKKMPDIPWIEIIGMRHRLIHAYFDVDLDILWSTVENNIPPLIKELEKALSSGNNENK